MNDSLKQLYYETRILLRVVILNNLIFRKNISSRLYLVIEGKQKNVKYNECSYVIHVYVHVQAVAVFYYWKILT